MPDIPIQRSNKCFIYGDNPCGNIVMQNRIENEWHSTNNSIHHVFLSYSAGL